MRITRTIREQITDQIRAEVLAGGFPEGQPLRESQLAERFGVSRGPIRDAFLQISQEGLLEYQANRGVTTRRSPSPEDRGLIVSLRQQMECFIVSRGIGKLNESGLGAIESALAQLDAACDRGDAAMIARQDMAFHEAILLGCEGQSFLPIWRLLCYQMLFAYSRLGDPRQIFEEHQRIFLALQTGKKSMAIVALKANII